MLEDLNTPAAFGHLFTAVKEIKHGTLTPEEATRHLHAFHFILAALGLQLPGREDAAEAPAEIRQLAENRWQAKLAKDWPLADQLRNQIQEKGWQIKDTPGGYELTEI